MIGTQIVCLLVCTLGFVVCSLCFVVCSLCLVVCSLCLAVCRVLTGFRTFRVLKVLNTTKHELHTG